MQPETYSRDNIEVVREKACRELDVMKSGQAYNKTSSASHFQRLHSLTTRKPDLARHGLFFNAKQTIKLNPSIHLEHTAQAPNNGRRGVAVSRPQAQIRTIRLRTKFAECAAPAAQHGTHFPLRNESPRVRRALSDIPATDSTSAPTAYTSTGIRRVYLE